MANPYAATNRYLSSDKNMYNNRPAKKTARHTATKLELILSFLSIRNLPYELNRRNRLLTGFMIHVEKAKSVSIMINGIKKGSSASLAFASALNALVPK